MAIYVSRTVAVENCNEKQIVNSAIKVQLKTYCFRVQFAIIFSSWEGHCNWGGTCNACSHHPEFWHSGVVPVQMYSFTVQ